MEKKPKSIQDFIEYKKNIEQERPILTAESRLITVDGVDGSGKSTIAKNLSEKLAQKFGEEKVILITTNVSRREGERNLSEAMKRRINEPEPLHKVFMAGVNRAYQQIDDVLKEGKIVVVDKSELSSLSWAIENDFKTVDETLELIKNGTLTHKLWAGNRIFISGKAEDFYGNLSERGNPSPYDPQDIEGVQKRINAERQAKEFFLKMEHQGEVNIIEEKNPRQNDIGEREEQLNKLVKDIAQKLIIEK